MARQKFSSINGPNVLIRSDVRHGGPSNSAAHTTSSRPSTIGTGGKGKTSGPKGLGLEGKTLKRHRKVLRDNIQGVTKGDIRRLARRGGVKRISGMIYDETRTTLRRHLEMLLKDIAAVVQVAGRKTVCVSDVVFVLNRLGRPIYGFGEGVR
ncbi:histone H4 [Lecanosticta acicola]|uniref:Histone H4 n=1 Tax=Lecanosticta acicola TaxID=111012 RepID=A0AAI8YVP2_9PEZI|nr:histone H4 [Lecanosticta acicola]